MKQEKKTLHKILSVIRHPKIILNFLPFETKQKKMFRTERKLRELNIMQNPKRQFDAFRKQKLEISEIIYHSIEELNVNPPEADVYITGSDQVWHDSYKEPNTSGWFLQFGKSTVKRLSYAASIGRELSNADLAIFRKFMLKFNAVSVREQSACDVCINNGIKAQVCVDPTMLLRADDYTSLATKNVFDKPFAFIYYLNVKSADEISWLSIKEYLKESNFALKSVTASGYCQGRELIENNTPLLATIPEWLGYMNDASCVFTTSFHGTVFAILMHRPFLTIKLNGQYSRSNARMEHLLFELGLTERFLNTSVPVKQQMNNPIDWQSVDKKIDVLRQNSAIFLRNNLA